MQKTIALILGGGQGKRLFPLTMYRSKPAVPIGGKYRLIDIPISNCLHSGIKDIYVLTQFNSESLNNHVNNTYRFDYFSRAFVRILAAEQTVDSTNWFQGTADAVRRNLLHLQLKGDEEILILSGDHLYDMDYRGLINFHREKKADVTVSTIPVGQKETSEFGILKMSRQGRISGFREKPKSRSDLKGYKSRGNQYLASMGVYIFNCRALKEALAGNAADFGKEVIPHSIKRLRAFGYIFNGYWKDVGTISSFYEVNMGMAASKPQFSFFYKGYVFTRPRFLPSARIFDSEISHSLVTEGSIIHDAEIKNSVVGLRSIIGKGCAISRTVLMGADYYEDGGQAEELPLGIGDGTSIDKAIVDKNARIGKNVIITNSKNVKNCDGANYFIRDGIVIIPKNARIKNGTKI
ncbi:MAG: glucose-1-phosphate adenylyltransferase [Candidatus Omnitrophica bacterium]|nr:glucose-1-phosphate adenylyltransferase [Candidatus Omnitrophota bacterium]MDD5436785.1 glucose-1-phosphate adenylyltransferase [Candidatus Omnitrophota bacterium]